MVMWHAWQCSDYADRNLVEETTKQTKSREIKANFWYWERKTQVPGEKTSQSRVVFKLISHSFAALTRVISSWILEQKFPMPARPYIILYLYFFAQNPKGDLHGYIWSRFAQETQSETKIQNWHPQSETTSIAPPFFMGVAPRGCCFTKKLVAVGFF